MVARILRPVVGIVGVVMLAVTTAYAVPLSASPPVEASAVNPLAGCPPDGSGVNFPGAEVEPWLEVNPTNGANVVGVYQQDRYSNGGSKGMTAAVSFDGGVTWAHVAVPNDTRCTGGAVPAVVRPVDLLRTRRGIARHEPGDRS